MLKYTSPQRITRKRQLQGDLPVSTFSIRKALPAVAVLALVTTACGGGDTSDGGANVVGGGESIAATCAAGGNGVTVDLCKEPISQVAVEATANGKGVEIFNTLDSDVPLNGSDDCFGDECTKVVNNGDKFNVVCVNTISTTNSATFGVVTPAGKYFDNTRAGSYGEWWTTGKASDGNETVRFALVGFMPKSSFNNGDKVQQELEKKLDAQFGDGFRSGKSCDDPRVIVSTREVREVTGK